MRVTSIYKCKFRSKQFLEVREQTLPGFEMVTSIFCCVFARSTYPREFGGVFYWKFIEYEVEMIPL